MQLYFLFCFFLSFFMSNARNVPKVELVNLLSCFKRYSCWENFSIKCQQNVSGKKIEILHVNWLPSHTLTSNSTVDCKNGFLVVVVKYQHWKKNCSEKNKNSWVEWANPSKSAHFAHQGIPSIWMNSGSNVCFSLSSTSRFYSHDTLQRYSEPLPLFSLIGVLNRVFSWNYSS